MSLVKTLARVAAGVILAKGIGTIMKNSQNSGPSSGTGAAGRSGQGRQTGGGILGDLLRNATSSGASAPSGSTARSSSASGGGLGDLLGQVLGGGAAKTGAGTARRYGGPNTSGASGGLGGLFDQITGAGRGQPYGETFGRSNIPPSGTTQTSAHTPPHNPAGAPGGLGDILGGVVAGGVGGILGGLLGGRSSQSAASDGLAHKDSQPHSDATFGEVINDSLSSGAEPQIPPTPEQNAVAGLLLRAMIQAAKSDGKIDDSEKQRLLAEFGELDEPERAFIREQMAAPVDPEGLARETPRGLGPQVYLVSLMAIDFDNEAEARYLHALAQALGLDQQQVNDIHAQVGVQNLYA